MGIFSKKECSICGDKSGLLSNKKLADGNLCKECRAKLSPFYEVTNRDTVAGIAAQLDYRERNRAALASFRPNIVAGGAGKVYIDRQSGKFAICTERQLQSGNPDLFDLRSLRSCSFFAKERIIKGDEDSSDHFEYDFYLRFEVEHPFLSGFSYRYNANSVTCTGNRIRESEIHKLYTGQKDMKGGFAAFLTGVDRKATEQYLNQYALGQDMIGTLMQSASELRAAPAFRQPAAPVYQQPAAPVYTPPASQANFCPNCGTRVSGGAFCPSCGARL